jgi:hypothetical protein
LLENLQLEKQKVFGRKKDATKTIKLKAFFKNLIFMPENPASKANEGNNDNKDQQEQPLPFHNPLKPDDDKQITQEDIENEQKFKEALSERD